jgi:hypothetical protein
MSHDLDHGDSEKSASDRRKRKVVSTKAIPGLIVAAFLALSVLAFWFLPPVIVRSDSSDALLSGLLGPSPAAVVATRQSVLFALGGLIAIISVTLSYYRHVLERRVADQSSREHSDRLAGEKLEYGLREEEARTSRYASAVAQLGSGEPDIELGGVYALAALSEVSPSQSRMITQVLVASFERRSQKRLAQRRREGGATGMLSAVEVAILDVLKTAGVPSLNLAGANLIGFDFVGASMPKVNLAGADLTNADFSEADLSGATLAGAKFEGASLVDAKLDNCSLRDADVSQADIRRTSFRRCNLNGADFKSAPSTYSAADYPNFSGSWWFDEHEDPVSVLPWIKVGKRFDGEKAVVPDY